MRNSIEIKVLENPGENWELLVEGFLEYRRRDPVASGIAALHTPKGQETMTEVLREMVQTINGPIVIAWDTQEQKVAGDIKARIIDREIIKQPYTEQPGAYKILGSSKWDEVTHQELNNIVEFYDKQSQDTDVLNRYPDIDRYATVYSCGVLEEYGKRGIGSLLMEMMLSELKQLNINVVYGDFSSIYSQSIATKFGFETIVSQKFEGNYLNYDKTPEDIRQLHTENWSMVKML